MNPRLVELSKQGSLALLKAVPRVALGGVLGALQGFLMLGALGGALAAASTWWWKHQSFEAPSWLWASLALPPVVLALAGGYVGAVRGLLAALARQVVEKQLVGWLYAQVKPAMHAAVKKVTPGSSPQAVAEALAREFEAPAQLDEPASLSDRLARFVVMRSRRALALSLITHVARAPNGEAAVAELEKLGVAKLEDIVIGNLEDLFALKLDLIAGGALVVCVLPQAVFALTR
ncbi:MAG: hypothetical protein DI536_27555 [Archangium gephyra]|uniref:Uncharacterized protein n=1 Tax=Archangium gephyra TaxID=48 RepID=A0A2W5SXB1_9BACT|nr:MAG: hypothetical protein DI536_27555 [Archangium gephyra]